MITHQFTSEIKFLKLVRIHEEQRPIYMATTKQIIKDISEHQYLNVKILQCKCKNHESFIAIK